MSCPMSALSVVFSAADQSGSGEMLTICQIPIRLEAMEHGSMTLSVRSQHFSFPQHIPSVPGMFWDTPGGAGGRGDGCLRSVGQQVD